MDAKERAEANAKILTEWKEAVRHYSIRLNQMVAMMGFKPDEIPDKVRRMQVREFVTVVNHAGKVFQDDVYQLSEEEKPSPMEGMES